MPTEEMPILGISYRRVLVILKQGGGDKFWLIWQFCQYLTYQSLCLLSTCNACTDSPKFCLFVPISIHIILLVMITPVNVIIA